MKTEESNTRRAVIKGMLATVAVWFGATKLRAESGENSSLKKTSTDIIRSDEVPLFSSAVTYGKLVFLSGKGAHIDGGIKAQTKHVLNEIDKELRKNGSSMEKVLKVNVYLHDLGDFPAMNEIYRGKFGDHPPVRTTIAAYGGIPGGSLIEIDCIAGLE